MDWAGLRFQDPAWLWTALASPLVLLFVWLRERDGRARAVAFPGASRLVRLRPGWRVRLRHLPTGVEVRCQRERNQSVNRLLAWTDLVGKLEWRKAEAANQKRGARELVRRQKRQKSRGQKVRMIQGKKHRAKIKATRGRRFEE